MFRKPSQSHYLIRHLLSLLFIAGLMRCETSPSQTETKPTEALPTMSANFDLQGHRGCRGLMPENSLPAFLRALDIGVTTLELDVVITADSQVLVSHEPFFSHEICLDPQGQAITEEEEKQHNIYQKSLEECQQYDCGSKHVERFPNQQKMRVAKPTLKEVFSQVETYLSQKGKEPVFYNIETKTTLAGDGVFHPEPEVFVTLLNQVIKEAKLSDRVYLQSFDVRTLQIARKRDLGLQLVLLVENEDSPQANLDVLGFTPAVYSPWFKWVDADLVSFCKEKKMKLIPWTVNEPEDIRQMIDLGVDGIISDYPNRVKDIMAK